MAFWRWGKEDSSPASFEKALSALSAKIKTTQTQLDQSRLRARKIKVLATLYIGFAYLVYAVVLLLVVGWKNMNAWEWTGMSGGPVLISLVRSITTIFFDYRIERLSTRHKDLQEERAKTIQKLKDATKYDSTLELLEKYGGSENRHKKGKKKVEDEEEHEGHGQIKGKKEHIQGQHQHAVRTGLPPPPTANIQRRSVTPVQQPLRIQDSPSPRPPSSMAGDAFSDFAPNAFDGKVPPSIFLQVPPARLAPPAESHWYDRILDSLLGEDETAAKNRIVLICSRCRLVNGQAPPGTKSLAELGQWKCMSCGGLNGEIDEGKRILQEALNKRGKATKNDTATETTDDEVERSSSEIVEVDKDESNEAEQSFGAQGIGKRKGKGI
ncbi:hypothetical protein QBC38DRAFT_459981 [Podospora fimiseda]|uniref:Endoplasmic reticulum junction formation protein lunapark n=1 Tax=Podospora fimiseda TaxID=252190 RepID=A0AAN6YPC4_9PEZI|nr:hypothetical protein QBC38DRAFT_459981 [Podospora fimiseda]